MCLRLPLRHRFKYHPERKRVKDLRRRKNMNKLLIIVLSMAIGVVAIPSTTVYAMKIAYVDIQEALQAVKAGKKAKQQVEKEIEKRQKKLDDMRNHILKLESELKKQELVLSEESKKKKKEEYTKKIQELQAEVAKNQQEMQQEEQKVLAPMLEKMRELLQKVSKEKGYDIVFMKGAILYADDQHDLTKDLVKTFDKEYKN